MYTISKQFHFSASHQLLSLPDDHPCKRMHGHNFIVELVLQSDTLDEHGFVRDFMELKAFKRFIDENLDHRHLNDVLPYTPTSENLARYLYECAKSQWPQVIAVRVSETPSTWAEYRES